MGDLGILLYVLFALFELSVEHDLSTAREAGYPVAQFLCIRIHLTFWNSSASTRNVSTRSVPLTFVSVTKSSIGRNS